MIVLIEINELVVHILRSYVLEVATIIDNRSSQTSESPRGHACNALEHLILGGFIKSNGLSTFILEMGAFLNNTFRSTLQKDLVSRGVAKIKTLDDCRHGLAVRREL